MKTSEKFQSLEGAEPYNTRGGLGIAAAILVGIGAAAGAEIISDWNNFKAGLLGRPQVR